MNPKDDPQIAARLKRIEGQVRGIARMIAEDRPCDQVLVQIMAVKAALDGLVGSLVEGQMEACLEESDPQALKTKLSRTLKLLSRGI